MRTQLIGISSLVALGVALGVVAETGCVQMTTQFGPPVQMAAGREPTFTATGDLNGDGNIDLVMTRSWAKGEVRILLGNGDGTFRDVAHLVANGSPQWPDLADYNGDGKLDLALVNYVLPDYVSILYGRGDGSFEDSANFLIGPSASSLHTIDLNGDGKPDFVAVNVRPEANGAQLTQHIEVDSNAVSTALTGRLVVMMNNGDGFDPARMINIEGTPRSVATGDWDGDGKPDAMVSVLNNTRAETIFFRGRGDGGFDEAGRTTSPFEVLGVSPPADVNKDGKADLIVGAPSGVVVFLGDGHGRFTEVFNANTETTRASWTADFDHDGNLDILTARRLFLGDGTGHFTKTALPHTYNNDSALAAADFNHDGWLDIVGTDMNRNMLDVYLNKGGPARPTASR